MLFADTYSFSSLDIIKQTKQNRYINESLMKQNEKNNDLVQISLLSLDFLDPISNFDARSCTSFNETAGFEPDSQVLGVLQEAHGFGTRILLRWFRPRMS